MTKSILIFTLALACPTSAIAQVATPTTTPTYTPISPSITTTSSTPPSTLHHREWEGSFFAGYAFLQDYKFRTIVSGSDGESPGVVEMHYASGYRLGARATQNFSEFFSATVEWGFSDQALRLTNVTPRAPNLNLNHFVHSLTYNVSFSPRTRDKRFRPHIEIGTGALLFHITEDSRREASARGVNLEASWEVLFNYGIGFKHLVADRYVFMADVKGRLSGVPTYGLPTSARLVDGQYQPAISAHGLMRAWQVNVGFAHQWDSW